MYTLKIENAKGEIFELSHNTQKYIITKVDGLTPPTVNVNTSTGTVDGSFFNSARLDARNIVITLILAGDIEANRKEIYRIFSLKKPCTIYFKNVNRDVKIIGYVETLESDLFVQQEKMQISLICPRPYFEEAETLYTELASITRMFSFPFAINEGHPIPMSEQTYYPLCTINNVGDTETGLILTVEILENITGFTIYNTTAGQHLGLKLVLIPGDKVIVNTLSRQKSIRIQRDWMTASVIKYMTDGSSWLTLDLGENNFTYTTSTNVEAIRVTFETVNLYGGV